MLLMLRTEDGGTEHLDEIAYVSIEEAYLDICAAIPNMIADLLRQRMNPFAYAFVLLNSAGTELLEVPFSELLPPVARKPSSTESSVPKLFVLPTIASLLDRSRALEQRSIIAHARAAQASDRLSRANRIKLKPLSG